MAEAVLALSILQVVVPVALAGMPAIWKQIVKVLKRIPKSATDPSQNKNLACIHTILDSLEHMPDLSWTMVSHSQSLLNKIKLEAESVEKTIVNDNRVQQYLHKGKIRKNIQSIAVMMQILETNIGVRRLQANNALQHKAYPIRLDLKFYQKSQENLCKDLHAKLREDNLEPVIIRTSEEYGASMERSGTYPRILHVFTYKPEYGYPRTLTTSRGVRECIELLLRWLRDLKLMQETINTGGSSLVGVALYELFTEILPKVLMQHLCERRSKLNSHTAKQFYSNLSFFRSFSVSSTFKAIQGEDGMQLEDEDKVSLDLQNRGWVTWNGVQQESSYTCGLENSPSLEVGTSSRATTLTTSGNMDSFEECLLCGLPIAGNSLDTRRRLLEQHFNACFEKEQHLNLHREILHRCPVCRVGMDHLSPDERELHANACLDKN